MKRRILFLTLVAAFFFTLSLSAGPAGITDGLVLWLDASEITEYNENDPVNNWSDQSGNNNDAEQTELDSMPIYLVDEVYDFAFLRFDGFDDYLRINSDILTSNHEITIISVVNQANTSLDARWINARAWQSSNSQYWPNWSMQSTVGSAIRFFLFTGMDNTPHGIEGTTNINNDQFFITTARFYPSLWDLHLDGELQVSTTKSGTIGDGTFRVTESIDIGLYSLSASDTYWGGDIAEIIVYNRALSDGERSLIEGELYTKYFEEPDEPSQPVELSSFTATIIANNYVQLRWTTETETNLLGYNVHRSRENDLATATKVNLLIIDGNGNSSQQQIYTFIDEGVAMNTLYYYWLEAIDLDITTNIHGPISIMTFYEEDQGNPPELEYVTKLIGSYPNPFNPGTNIRFELERAASVSVIIYNILGQQIRALSESFEAGDNTLYWDGKDDNGNPSQSGIFFYRFSASIGYEQYDKMILLK
ncbi:MAG: T9SS type A sorting domain-containing protein [Candidatus Cloacimonetes bacterium]|nr:T9SS type A sorting domain-containing protein [Candidatus Cloacimonadota bacterium]